MSLSPKTPSTLKRRPLRTISNTCAAGLVCGLMSPLLWAQTPGSAVPTQAAQAPAKSKAAKAEDLDMAAQDAKHPRSGDRRKRPSFISKEKLFLASQFDQAMQKYEEAAQLIERTRITRRRPRWRKVTR